MSMRCMKSFLIIFLVLISFSITGDVLGDSRITDYYSPDILGTQSSMLTGNSPQGDGLNPAVSATRQRVTLDLSYVGIAGADDYYQNGGSLLTDGSGGSFLGHGLNLGILIPTKAGVFGVSGHMIYSDYQYINFGVQGGINASFSKDVYRDFHVGVGLKIGLGDNRGITDPIGWYTMLDIGVVHRIGNLGPLTDFQWAASLQNLGWGNLALTQRMPALFTPAGAVSFTYFENDVFKMEFSGDLSFPTVQNLELGLGTDITILDTVTVQLASSFDVRSLIDQDWFSMVPSLGITVGFDVDLSQSEALTERGWNYSEVDVHTAVKPLKTDLYGFGVGINAPLGVYDNTPPAIEFDLSGFDIDVSVSGSEESGLEDGNESENSSDQDSDGNDTAYIPMNKGGAVSAKGRSGNDTVSFRHKKGADSALIQEDSKDEVSLDDEKAESTEDEPRVLYYLSPNLDGLNDELIVPFKISDTRYIKGYALYILDLDGNVVREIGNKEEREENSTLNFFELLFQVKSGITVPEELRWDGLSDSGETVPDGVYQWYAEAWDDNLNRGRSAVNLVVVDNTDPVVSIQELEAVEKIFSPNDDGNKDTLTIFQEGSAEDSWVGYIRNVNGDVQRTFLWNNGAPEEFVWDGTDDNGFLVPDGVYSYDISTTDRAKNSVSTAFSNIIINTEVTPISLSIDNSYFSPNGDGRKDVLTFIPEIPNERGITHWELSVLNSAGRKVRSFTGAESKPGTLVFEGADDDGAVLSEGQYRAELEVFYLNGNAPEAESPGFVIDVTLPEGAVKSDIPVFSPDGDGKKDVITIYQESSAEELWSGAVYNSQGLKVKSYTWLGQVDYEFQWDGYSDSGEPVTDGEYFYRLESEDKAGNLGYSDQVVFSIDTRDTPIRVSTNLEAFSPNGDRVQDAVLLTPVLQESSGVDRFSLVIKNQDDQVVRVLSEGRTIRDSYEWKGFLDSGMAADDGVYYGELQVYYTNGNDPVAKTRQFVIDTAFPDAQVVVDLDLFSPNGDGRKDVVRFSQSTSEEQLWTGLIKNSVGEVVKQILWKGRGEDFVWDGKDENGNALEDGVYTYELSTADAAGNAVEVGIDSLIMDTAVTRIFLTADERNLSPNGDGLFEEIEFSLLINNKTGIESWTLAIEDSRGNLYKEFKGEDRVPSKIVWDGKGDDRNIREGVFNATLSTLYTNGNLPESAVSDLLIDVTPPAIMANLSPIPFSPDNDGVDDEVAIAMNVTDFSEIENWRMDVFDPEGRFFHSFSGIGQPSSRILWDGKSAGGSLVFSAEDYPYRVTVKDSLGNVGIQEGVIPVDVLVIRDGDRLKIQIANINFLPDSPELITDDPAVAAKNDAVLNRLKEILNKYRTYNIKIEGHANAVRWYDAELAAKEEVEELLPLSLSRAETVRQELVNRGIPALRIDVEGMGGSEPIVDPRVDQDAWKNDGWQNRRVEFILEK